MWLTISFITEGKKNREKYSNAQISFSTHKTIIESRLNLSYRTSQIFPLKNNVVPLTDEPYFIFFYNYDNPYRNLGKIRDEGETSLIDKVWFSIGLSSIILITDNASDDIDLRAICQSAPRTIEKWSIAENRIINHKTKILSKIHDDFKHSDISNYDVLSQAERATIDEFVSGIDLIIHKIAIHCPSELETFYSLVRDVNELIDELVFVKVLEGQMPTTLAEYTKGQLEKYPELRIEISHQNIERLVQINSALSYITTQMLSGAAPLLERRSLIRRHSLLGVGCAIHSLNRITRSIESVFSAFPFKEIIDDRMNERIVLLGAENLFEINTTKWTEFSFEIWAGKYKAEHNRSVKIPFFSGRLGFRETEYTISAAIQCLSSGAGIEWNLITITHEMMHSHVRDLIAKIFYGADKDGAAFNRSLFYKTYVNHLNGNYEGLKLVDYIRNLFGQYILNSFNLGSITNLKKPKIEVTEYGQTITGDRKVMKEDRFWEQFEKEHRNISEIIVHVLDFHYFYSGRINSYIPIIWKSWASLPYVNGDIYQYILRSLLIISMEYDGDYIYRRYHSSINKMIQIIDLYQDNLLNATVIQNVKEILMDKEQVDKMLDAFESSIILVDMANKIFLTPTLKGELFDDTNVEIVEIIDKIEAEFRYLLPDGFNDATIKRPAAYLLHRYIKQLTKPIPDEELEKNTAIYFLACNSN